MKRRNRSARDGMFVVGLAVAGVSFLVYLVNGMAMEGASHGAAVAGLVGMVGGSILAGAGGLRRVVRARRFLPLAVTLAGGLAGAAGGWFLGSLLFSGNWTLEAILAVCLAPCGLWLGLLAGTADERANEPRPGR